MHEDHLNHSSTSRTDRHNAKPDREVRIVSLTDLEIAVPAAEGEDGAHEPLGPVATIAEA